jgi:hypothetical protein
VDGRFGNVCRNRIPASKSCSPRVRSGKQAHQSILIPDTFPDLLRQLTDLKNFHFLPVHSSIMGDAAQPESEAKQNISIS